MAGLVPASSFLTAGKTWMPGIADKFTQSAQSRLLWPGMTSYDASAFISAYRSDFPSKPMPGKSGMVM
jgi:hypothetical protein